MSKLVLIGGPPGVGKTTVIGHLEHAFERCACLDADDAWRVHPRELVDERLRPIAVGNVVAVLRGYLEAGFPLVLLTWVLADPKMIERILKGLDGLYGSALILHLVASREVLEDRFRRKRGGGKLMDYALFKLSQIEALPYPKIDTSDLASEAVSERIVAEVRKAVSSGP